MQLLAWVATGLVLGALLRPWDPGADLGVALIATAVASSLAAASAIRRPTARVAAGLVLGLLAGASGTVLAREPVAQPLPSGVARITGEVVTSDADERGPRVNVRVTGGAYLGAGVLPRDALVTLYGVSAARGDVVTTMARLRPVVAFRNPSPHPDWPAASRPQATGNAMTKVTWQSRSVVGGFFHGARCRVRRGFQRTLTPRHAALAQALILGDAAAVDRDARDDVRNAGLAHVLAVSGLHVAIVLGISGWILRRGMARLGPVAARYDTARVAAGLAVPLALALAEFAGGSPSAWRASVTAAVMQGLVAAGRRPSVLGITAFTVLVLGVVTPDMLARPSFVLSIVATVVVLTTPRIAGDGLRAAVLMAVRISLRSIIATLPITLWCFTRTAWIGVVANVVAVPLASWLLIPLGALHAVTAALGVGSGVTGALFSACSDAFLGVAWWFGSVPGAAPPPLTVPEVVCVSLLCVSWLVPFGWRKRLVFSVVLALAFGAAEAWVRTSEAPEGVVRATFLDVGQGDAAVVDLPSGALMVVDTGGSPGGGPDPGARVLVPLLQARRRAVIDVLVITHAHPDHYGGLAAVLDAVGVRELWIGSQGVEENPRGEFAALVRAARLRGVRVRTERDLCGATSAFGARITVLGPCPGFDAGYDLNDNSLAFRVDGAGGSVLFTGDMEAHSEAVLVGRGAPLRADVLKVGHHGSRTSSTTPFLRAVSPRLAVLSAGAQNRFGHPHPEVLERLRHAGTAIARTDERGGCIVTLTTAGPREECVAFASGD